MSEQEQKLIRLQAWDDYCEAKRRYLAAKAKADAYGRQLIGLGQWMAEIGIAPRPGSLQLPDSVQVQSSIDDLQSSIEALRTTRKAATEFGFAVDEKDQGILNRLR